jgi:hypothetical protein
MQHVLEGKFNPSKLPKIKTRYLQMYQVPQFTGDAGSLGMKMPEFANVLHIDTMGLYILLQGCPGHNFFSGVHHLVHSHKSFVHLVA